MDVRYPPVVADLTKQYRFNRAAVDCTTAIGSGDGFDTRDPGGTTFLALRSTDEGSSDGGAEGGFGTEMMASILGTVALDAPRTRKSTHPRPGDRARRACQRWRGPRGKR